MASIAGTAGLALAPRFTAATPAASASRPAPFINHCHIAAKKFGRDTSGRPHVGTVGDLQETLADAGVAGAVVFAPFVAQEGRDPNEWLVHTLASHPNLVGFAAIDPKHPDAARRVRDCAAMKLKGIKIHPPVMKTALNDPACRPFFAAAEELRLPVVCHTGAHGWYLKHYLPLLLDDIARDHPKLPILIEHVGGMALFDQALSVLMNHKQTTYAGYTMETGPTGRFPESGLRAEQIRTLRDVAGPARIVYGHGYPWNSDNRRALRDDLAEIRAWGLPAEETDLVLGGNLRRLIGG
ncbi:MAG: amidohydrolase family protein [Verrucomicrobia bacterium]|nr:amidohydrolase family protein [Verrucomicrobiota bacterium]